MSKVGLAKITRPGVRTAIERDRLFERLDDVGQTRLIWVSGPPGAGKTTLVGSYIENRRLPCLWYQFDRGDADIATFFYYLGQAVRESPYGRDADLPLLGPEYLDDVASFTRRFFRQLFASCSEPVRLVFDNFHELPPQSTLPRVFQEGLDEVPSGCEVLVISRNDPPPQLARLRVSGALNAIGWNELRLTREESDRIARQRRPEMDEETLQAVYQRTSGWAAGLILLLEHGAGDAGPVDGQGGFMPQVLFDYLAGEIYDQLSEPMQSLLLGAACLRQLTAEMATELTGMTEAGQYLQQLAKNGYFVTERMFATGSLYELHPLFTEFLLRKARDSLSRDDYARQREQAAGLCLRAGQVEGAIETYLELGRWNRAAEVISAHAAGLIDQGRGETMANWFDDFPPETLDRDPWLAYWSAASRFHSTPRESRRLYERSHALFAERGAAGVEGRIVAGCGVVNAVLHEMDDLALIDPWLGTLSRDIAAGEESLDPRLRARAITTLFTAGMYRRPDYPELRDWLNGAYEISRASGDLTLRFSIEPQVCMTILWTGHFQRARHIIDALRQFGDQHAVPPMGALELGYVEAMYHMLVNDQQQCLASVNAALEIASGSGIGVLTNQLLTTGAAACIGAGDLAQAEELLERLRAGTQQARRFDRCLYNYVAGWHALLQGETVEAYHFQKEALRFATEVGIPFYEVICRLAMALITAGSDERKCAVHLRKVHALTRNINSHLLEFMALLPYAYIALEHGRRQSGLNSLRYAFALGREHAYHHVLGWMPQLMARLCTVALEEGIETEYARTLVRERGLFPDTPPYHLDNWPWRYRVRTLGGFELLRDRQPLAAEGKAQRRPNELLKALIAFGGHDVRCEQVAEALWPHVDGDYAYRSLTTTLHRLRKLLGDDDAVLLRDGRLSLDPRQWWVDSAAFSQAAGELELGLRNPTVAARGADLEQLGERVLALYAGGFLPAENDLPQFLTHREQLRARFTRCLIALARYRQGGGDLERAIQLLERGIEADADNELLVGQLMTLLREAGRSIEVAPAYERLRAALWSTRQATPSAQLRALLAEDGSPG